MSHESQAPDATRNPGITTKLVIVALLICGVATALYMKGNAAKPTPVPTAPQGQEPMPVGPVQPTEPPEAEPAAAAGLPKLVDLGASKCIPCKMMAPILEELEKEYAGKLDVEFIDVWKDPEAGREYKINMIPTQIFLDASGKELFRHEGFFSKEEILSKWRDLGMDLPNPQPTKPSS